MFSRTQFSWNGIQGRFYITTPQFYSSFLSTFIANSRGFFACMQPFSTQWAKTLIKAKKNVEFRETALFAFVLILPTNCTHTHYSIYWLTIDQFQMHPFNTRGTRKLDPFPWPYCWKGFKFILHSYLLNNF